MVTSKRKIVNEEDKLGYFEDVVARDTKEESVSMRFNNDLTMTRSYVDAPSRPLPAEPRYTRVVKPEPEMQAVEKKFSIATRPSAYAPVIAKRASVDVEIEEKTTTAAVEKTLTKTMKRALVAYITVVLALTIAIIATGVIINGITTEIDGYEASRTHLSQTIALQEAELAALSDPNVIKTMAEEIGMVAATNTVTTETIDVKEPPQSSDPNWFDAFCDSIGGIFGG